MAKSESWTEWILSSYSESINPPTFDIPTLTAEPDTITTTDSSSSSTSPYGPYTKNGRGGAGNFAWETSLAHKTSFQEADLEAQALPQRSFSASTVSLTLTPSQPTLRPKKRPSAIHTGRGGAGNNNNNNNHNLATPSYSHAAASPHSPAWPISPTTPPATSTARSFSTSAGYGRGGAGNLSASAVAANAARDERVDSVQRMADGLRSKAEHDVECMLKPPEGAFLAPGRGRGSTVEV